MQRIGSAGLSRKSDNVYSAGAFLRWRGGRMTGGYGAEVYRLMCRYAVHNLGAVKVLASDTSLDSKAAIEEAGFRLVSSFPPQHAKRRRGYGTRHYEWTPHA
jgi:hypothetical protein